MNMVMKGRILSLFGHYDVYEEPGNQLLYTIHGELSWSGKFAICGPQGKELAVIHRKLLSFFPTFEIEENGRTVGSIEKDFSLFRPRYTVKYLDWKIDGNFFQTDYTIRNAAGLVIAQIHQKLLALSQTFEIHCPNPADAFDVVVLATAIARVEVEEENDKKNSNKNKNNNNNSSKAA